MFLTYVIKIDTREVPRLLNKHIHVLRLLLVFPGKLPLCSQSESLWVISIIWPPRSDQFEMFSVTYVIKVDKREVLRLSFEHIHVLLLFLVFSRKVTLTAYRVKVNNFGSYSILDPLVQANLRGF